MYSVDGIGFDHDEMITVLEEAQARNLIDEFGVVVIYTKSEYTDAPRSVTVKIDVNQKGTIRGFSY